MPDGVYVALVERPRDTPDDLHPVRRHRLLQQAQCVEGKLAV